VSAPNAVAFVGLRFDVSHDEVAKLEARRDVRQLAARKAGLSAYWGKVPARDAVLLVGLEVANLGPENLQHAAIDLAAMQNLMERVARGLVMAELDGEARLHLQYFDDA
jgi:hypothetical protein